MITMTNNPVRLQKISSDKKEWEQKLEPYVPYLLILSLIILALLIFALACVIMGVSAHSFTGTEANVYYNNLEAII